MCAKCYKCFRPIKSCYCKYITPIATKSKIVFLMHPKEAYKQKTGTGRLASLSLIDSEIIIDVDFTNNKRLNALLADSQYFPIILYPGNDSITAKSEILKTATIDKKLLVIVVDATWLIAKKMMKLSKNLHSLQKISFLPDAGYHSQFSFKRQPAADYLSTIESCYYLLNEFKQVGIEDNAVSFEPLMDIFHKMVNFQIESHKEREKQGIPSRYQNINAQTTKLEKQKKFEEALENLN